MGGEGGGEEGLEGRKKDVIAGVFAGRNGVTPLMFQEKMRRGFAGAEGARDWRGAGSGGGAVGASGSGGRDGESLRRLRGGGLISVGIGVLVEMLLAQELYCAGKCSASPGWPSSIAVP